MARKKDPSDETPSLEDHAKHSAFTDIIRSAAVAAAAKKLGHESHAFSRVEQSIDKMADETIAAIAAREGATVPPPERSAESPVGEGGTELQGPIPLFGGLANTVHDFIAGLDPAVKQRIVTRILELFGIS